MPSGSRAGPERLQPRAARSRCHSRTAGYCAAGTWIFNRATERALNGLAAWAEAGKRTDGVVRKRRGRIFRVPQYRATPSHQNLHLSFILAIVLRYIARLAPHIRRLQEMLLRRSAALFLTPTSEQLASCFAEASQNSRGTRAAKTLFGTRHTSTLQERVSDTRFWPPVFRLPGLALQQQMTTTAPAAQQPCVLQLRILQPCAF